ncbi:hypothetical protein L211DRAFT_868988 [Terfezia boudieri ATCC MYA-4762]|uniref:Uncharacterized protein n=1 Tax=Terfezia boudieri ATCC MYA-4762 TaxID=1051890 RepID=A0A3N4LMA0_9PEZI|nr:hypothetical protein L211DRAFT_868988 [Terfezia boudieri ATCC MYA-4762]
MSSDQNRENSAVSRGGTGAAPTPANTSPNPREGRSEYASGRRDRSDVSRGTDREGIMGKITRTSNTGIGKDSASQTANVGERLGFGSSGRDDEGPGVIGKASETARKVTTEGAKGMFAKAQQQLGTPPNVPRSHRRSSLMSRKELTTDFLANYCYEMRTEIGEPESLGFSI